MPSRSKHELVAEIGRYRRELDLARIAESGQDSDRLRLYEAMLESVPVGVVLANRDGRIVYGNAHVEELVGHPVIFSEDYDSYGAWISYHPDGRQVESHEYPLSRVLREGADHAELTVHYQRGDGCRRWISIVGRSVRASDGRLIGATVAMIDIDPLRRLQEDKDLLIGELNHRVKNAFTVVQSILAQSVRRSNLDPKEGEALVARVSAYARAHSRSIGRGGGVALTSLVEDTLVPLCDGRLEIAGPPVQLNERLATLLSLSFYELATNATKYGSLSNDEGRVTLRWAVVDGRFAMDWRESGGPPVVAPSERGFGTQLLERALTMQSGGTVRMAFPADGLRWTFEIDDYEFAVEAQDIGAG